MIKVNMRTEVLVLEAQDLFTRDNVSARLNAIVYYRVVDAKLAVLEISELESAVHQLICGQLRDTLSSKDFSEILANRESHSKDILAHVSAFAKNWGVLIERVQLKNLDIVDQNMVRAMAKEAEATRDKTSAVIRAEGELDSAKLLVDAANIMLTNPVALELRRLQTLEKISKEKSQHTVIVPMDFTSTRSSMLGGLTTSCLKLDQESEKEEVKV